MSIKSCATREAPPISPPSTFIKSNIFFALFGVTLPPYKTLIELETEVPYLDLIFFLIISCTSLISSSFAVFPVPIAQIGSYAIIKLLKFFLFNLNTVSSSWLTT